MAVEKKRLTNEIIKIIENSKVTFGEVTDILNYLIAFYSDKGNNLLNSTCIQEIAKQSRFRY